MLLLITSEPNITSDFITLRFGEDVFRFNVNLWADYKIMLTRDGWEIANKATGRSINSGIVTRTYWWKAFNYVSADDNYVKEEIRYAVSEIYGWCVERGIAKGNSPLYHRRFGKLAVLGKAAKYFLTPRTLVTVGLCGLEELQGKPAIAKSLASGATSDNKVLMTTEVDVSMLDPNYPWYLQEKIDSAWDVTVFYCNDRCFPFRRSRKQLRGLDWRVEQFTSDQTERWMAADLDAADEDRIRALSKDLDIEFGRYDFLTIGDTERLVFLELNAAGQWIFLDPEGKYGLLDSVVTWLRS